MSEREAPPPSSALLERLGAMKPVKTRVPWRSLAAVLAIWAALGAALLPFHALRPDLKFLPRWWVASIALAWAAALAVPLYAALMPRRGQVLPDPARAGASALGALMALLAITFLFTVEAPGYPYPATSLAATVIRCLGFVLKAWAAPFVVGLFAIRRLAPVGTWRAGAALGAAGGALGGLLLHFLCGYPSALHVGLGHAGGVVLCALLGAAIAPFVVRR